MNSLKHLNTYLLFVLISLLSACSSLPKDFEKTDRYALAKKNDSTLGSVATIERHKDAEKSTMQVLSKGREAFINRLALLSLAEQSIDVQYFIWKSDIIGNVFMHKMLEAADRGVRVRLLLDDMNINAETHSTLVGLDHHPNIHLRIYNPISAGGYTYAAAVSDALRINHRMHNKSFTVDSHYTIVGGRNIEANYFDANKRSNFEDIDLIATGPVVDQINTQFDIYFNSALAIPGNIFSDYDDEENQLPKVRKKLADYYESIQESDYALDVKDTQLYQDIANGKLTNSGKKTYHATTHVIYDSPEKTLGKTEEDIVFLRNQIRPYVNSITESLELVSPYFIPGDQGTEDLISFVKRGVKVKVLTNSLASTDGIMAQSGYYSQRRAMLEGGIELYELKPTGKSKASRSLRSSGEAIAALHAKTFIFDREEIFIGSFNLDPRSSNINTELGIVCATPEMATDVAVSIFDNSLKDIAYQVILEDDELVWIEYVDGKEIRHTTEPKTSWWRRFNVSFYSFLPIESQL